MIESIPFYLLRVDECYTFGNRIAGLLTNFDLEGLQLSMLSDKFGKSLSLLDASLIKESTRSYTMKVLDADKNRDDSFLALRYYVQACTKRRNTAFREAATLLSDTIKNYGWSLYNESLSKESSRLNNLISDLENKPSLKMAVSTLGLQEWFNELKQAQTDFEAAEQERTLTKASVSQIKSEDACMAVRRDCELLFRYIDLNQQINPSEDYQSLIRQINEVIGEYSAAVKSRKTRNTKESLPEGV